MDDPFADTSGWAAWLDVGDRHHDLAVALVDDFWQRGRRLVTTNWVLAELTALLTSPLRFSKPRQITFLDEIRSDPDIEVVRVTSDIETDAWQLWRTRRDKDWTLVDCASFVVMNRLGLTDAVTADHHFDQAGFARLLR